MRLFRNFLLLAIGAACATLLAQTGDTRGSTVTGVPRYRAGFRGPHGTQAPAATRQVVVTGAAASEGKGTPAGSSATAGATISPSGLTGMPPLPNPLGVPPGTPIQVRLAESIDSGHAHNGQRVQGTLVAAVGSAPAGAPVELTVVASASAGQMSSFGELSLQITSIAGKPVLSEVVTAEGKEGKRLSADGAAQRGTEAILTPDDPITLPYS